MSGGKRPLRTLSLPELLALGPRPAQPGEAEAPRETPEQRFHRILALLTQSGGRDWQLPEELASPAEAKEWHQRAWDMINAAKSAPCEDCGVAYPACVMDFDHVRGQKFFCVSSLLRRRGPWWRERYELIRDELAKCELVCANCHRFRHYQRRRERSRYGSIYIDYKGLKCSKK